MRLLLKNWSSAFTEWPTKSVRDALYASPQFPRIIRGTASVQDNDPLMSQYPGAVMIVRVAIREIFGNCPRYVHKMQLVKRSKFVPKSGVDTPEPVWKYLNAIQDVLPDNDAKKVAANVQQGKAKIGELDMTKTIREQIAETD